MGISIPISKYIKLIRKMSEERYKINSYSFGTRVSFIKDDTNLGKCEINLTGNSLFQLEKYYTEEFIIDKPEFHVIFTNFKNHIFKNLMLKKGQAYLKGPLLYIETLLDGADYATISSLFRILLSYLTMNITTICEFIFELEPRFNKLHSLELLKFKIMFYVIFKESLICNKQRVMDGIEKRSIKFSACHNLFRIHRIVLSLFSTFLTHAIVTEDQCKLEEFHELLRAFESPEEEKIRDISYRLICTLDNLDKDGNGK